MGEKKDELSISEATDFEFEVIEKNEETSGLEPEEVFTSQHNDSPFDKKIKVE